MTRDKRREVQTSPIDVDKSVINPQLPSLESVMLHPSDKIIKPIIGNKAIEILIPTTFNKNKLPFQSWRIDKIKELCKSNNMKLMENYLLVIYSLMEQYFSRGSGSKDSGDEENLLNVLNYFETIIQDKEIANNIINTSFISLLISILKSTKSEVVKIRICCIIAFLIRYSTVIETPLETFGLCKILEGCIQSKNLELARKATATIGEYLFFVATQAEGEEESTISWTITEDNANTLLWAIEYSRDDVVKFYATKAIENITALTMISKKYFASNDSFITKLIESYGYTKNNELKTSIIYTISHLIRLEPRLYRIFIEKKGLIEIKKNLEEETSKNQQAIINCILFGAKQDNSILVKNENFVNFCMFLMNLLESGVNVVLKMKIILIFGVILENTSVIAKFGEKLFLILTKLRKDTLSELHQIIKVFEANMKLKIKIITKNFISIINGYFNNKPISNFYDEIIQGFNAFSTIGLYPKLVPALFSIELLDILIKLLDVKDLISDETLRKNVYNILKSFSENSNSVQENSDFVLKKLVVPIVNSSLK